MAKANLTPARLREVLSYSPESGLLVRRVRTSKRIKVDDVAGYVHSSGYVYISIGNRLCLAHQKLQV